MDNKSMTVKISLVCPEDGSEPDFNDLFRLLQAAPDLYLALRDIMRVISTDDLIPESVSYMKQARAALFKAVGEKQYDA